LLAEITLQQFAQLSANGIINGAAYGLLGVGFALILGVTGRFHFAYSFTYSLATYLAFTLHSRGLKLNIWVALLLALALVTALGVVVERHVYQPLAIRAGATALLAIFVAALGIGIAGENLIRLFWGSSNQQLTGIAQKPIRLWGERIIFLNYDVYQVLSAVALVLVLSALLKFTPLGRAIKATRGNPEMAQIIGINPKGIYMVCFGIGTLFSGVAGFWYGVKFSVVPDMGLRPVIFAFVVAFLAGTARSPIRVFAMGIAVSLIEQWSSMFMSVRWTQTAVFVILIGYLISQSVDLKSYLNRGRRGRVAVGG
jgi:branched-chain amino acid transport system permease protein